jgi:hypothetical protein
VKDTKREAFRYAVLSIALQLLLYGNFNTTGAKRIGIQIINPSHAETSHLTQKYCAFALNK